MAGKKFIPPKKESKPASTTDFKTTYGLDSFFGQASLEKASELYERLQQPLIKRGDTGTTHRVLNKWVKDGIIDNNINEYKRFTFSEFIWIKIIEELRKATCGIAFIKTFKQNLLAPLPVKGILTKIEKAKHYIDELKLPPEQKKQLLALIASNKNEEENRNLNMLHLVIVESILKKVPLSICIFSDGTYLILDAEKIHRLRPEDVERKHFETHVTISISGILKQFLLSDLSGYIVPKVQLFSYAENKLFEVVHSGEYESITVHFKDKKIKTMELTKSEDVKQKIVDILSKGAFGEILIKKHKGLVTKIENTTKIIL